MSAENDNDLERTQKLYEFLQGQIPEGYTVSRKLIPRLTAAQAWTVVWYLGNQYWKVPDTVERCDVCGDLFHTWQSGTCLDYGKAPYHFCDDCMGGDEYAKKSKSRLNPENKLHHEQTH
jgi:hypothetical protein